MAIQCSVLTSNKWPRGGSGRYSTLKGKLTVPCESRNLTPDLILDPLKFRESSLELSLVTGVGSFEFQVEKNNELPILALIRVYEYSRASSSLLLDSLSSSLNRPNQLTQCCTQFKPFGNKLSLFSHWEIQTSPPS